MLIEQRNWSFLRFKLINNLVEEQFHVCSNFYLVLEAKLFETMRFNSSLTAIVMTIALSFLEEFLSSMLRFLHHTSTYYESIHFKLAQK